MVTVMLGFGLLMNVGIHRDVLRRAAVRGAREREMARAEPEALDDARAHAPERLQRLHRRAREHGEIAVRPLDRTAGLHDAPRDPVLGLLGPAPERDDPRQRCDSRQRCRLSCTIRSASSRSYQPSTTTSLPSGCL